ncbi:hypothetical protein OIU84_013960 [Salix udensis]|uniref:Bet v I/Major latex protein domain-containing protein n=1 Tax=Salix udensis TaxID=889485 RepID=A0AAD6JBY7_9ROSI|nr:hypothetical protein OIU84_013960 [Salix udensis]
MASGTILGEYSSSAVQADRLWKAAFFDGHNLLPKILPGIITSIDILKGDSDAVHSVRMTNFTDVKSYSVGFCVTSTDEGGCLVKMEIVYESIGESLLPKKDANDLQQGIL